MRLTDAVPSVEPGIAKTTFPVGSAAPLAGFGVITEVRVKVPPLTEPKLDVTVLAVVAWAIVKATA